MVTLIGGSEILKPTTTLPTACGVKVLTWGTSFNSGSGILHVLDSTLFGGNSGHAALLLTFPNNEEGKRLMALCKKNRIPCKEKTVYYDQNGNEIREEVIQVNWSWCSPNEKDENFPHFLQTAEEDLLGARQAIHFEWDLEKIAKLQLDTPEQRHHHGLLSSHVASYGPAKVLHTRNLSDGQHAFLESKNAAELLAKKEATVNILSEKLLKNKEKLAKYKTVKLGVTEQLILNKYLPEWKKLVKNSNKISIDELNALIDLKDKYLLQLKSIEFLKDNGLMIAIFNDLKGHLQDKPIVLSDSLKEYLYFSINSDVKENEKMKMISELANDELLEMIKDIFEDFKGLIEGVMKDNENPIKMNVAKSLKAENLKRSIDLLKVYLDNQLATPLNELLISALEDLNPFLGEWKSIIGDVQEISPAQIRDLYEKANIKYKEVENDIIPFNYYLMKMPVKAISIEDDNLSDYLTTGTPITKVVTLPILPMLDPLEGVGSKTPNQGLDAKAMLEKMIQLSDRNAAGYHAVNKNCASTTSAILEAGALTKKQKKIFKNYTFGFLVTPQDCFNNALDFQSDFYNPSKISVFSKIKTRLDNIPGKFLGVLLDPEASGLKKMGAVLGGCLVTPVALAVFVVRKILNPLDTVKDARRFANYAFSKNSITLKTVSLITLAPAIVLSPLAALQYGLKKLIVDPVNTLLTTKPKVIRKQNGENMISDYDKYIQLQKNESLKKVINSFTAEIDKKTKVDDAEIGANPEKALAAFKIKLENDQCCIPVFNKETQAKVIGYINKHPEKREDYDALMLKAANRVVGVVEQYKKEEARELKKIKPN